MTAPVCYLLYCTIGLFKKYIMDKQKNKKSISYHNLILENYFLRREADIKPINLWISRFFTEQLQEYTSQGASFSNENLYSLVDWIE